MRAIFHVHTVYSGDALISVPLLIQRCIRERVDVLFITEHNNMDSYALALDCVNKNNIPIVLVPCEEIASQEGELIGVYLKEPIPRGLSLIETATRIKAQGGVIVIPHPFDTVRKERVRNKEILQEILNFIDVVEVYNARCTPLANKLAQEWAEQHNLLTIGGADAHFKGEIGNCILELPAFDNPSSFLSSLKAIKIVRKRRSLMGIPMSGLLKKWRKIRVFHR